MIKVVVTGSECTGKSTLAKALSDYFEGALVTEYARTFVEQKGSAPDYEDVEAIARGQMSLEDEIAAARPELLVLDTDLLSTWVYSCHYYGRVPLWIGKAVNERRADLYLLAGIDVPWIADGLQRDRGHVREEMQALFRRQLEERGFYFVDIEGSLEKRTRAAIAAVSALAGQGP
jgi:NadR type nicotinamide-nucleotide adenylyltransferase